MLFDIAVLKGVAPEDLLRRYTEFKGQDGKVRCARSVDEMSEPWVIKTLDRVERDWRGEPAEKPQNGSEE